MTTNKLTAKSVQNAKPKELESILKDNYLPDGGGLYLIVTARGGKLWRYHFSFQNKKYRLPLGKYPQLSLKDARELHKEAQSKKAKGINPVEEKRKEKQLEKSKEKSTFKEISEDWLEKQKGTIAESTHSRHIKALEKDFYPIIGNKIMADIEKGELVKIAKKIQDRGSIEMGNRSIDRCNQIWRYALQLDKVKHNIVADISKKDALKPTESGETKTILEPKRIGELLRAIDDYKGDYTTKACLQLLPHVTLRSQSIRLAEWKEIDFDNSVWIVPSEHLKLPMKHKGLREYDLKLHLTPKALEILKELHPYTKDAKYIFHSPRNRGKALSDQSLRQALIRLGFGNDITPHGVRAMFSTLANESGKFRREVVESILGHKDSNEVRRAYNRANYEDEKRELLEWWSGFLEGVKCG